MKEEHLLKKLEWLQAIFTRMASNSLLLKGWATTVAAALLGLAAKETDRSFALLALYPALVFWSLDAYYLWLERCYRAKYEQAAQPLGLSLSLSLPANKAASLTYPAAFVALATWPLYVSIVSVSLLIVLCPP